MPFALKVASIAETITVVGTSDPVFSSGRTGAATAVTRDELATLPTISGRITDITRLTPQYGGNGSIAGQDNRANNMTVDGSYFNNSFGLGVTTGGIGDRTGVAPISLEAIEQVQVSVAPYDVRQGNFTGAGINTVTRSGTNKITASVYHRMRNESYVGTEAAGLAVNPGIFDTNTTGVWVGGPIVKNKLFAFGAYEKQNDTRPLTTFTVESGRRAGRRQHHPRLPVRSRRAQPVPVAGTSTTRPARSTTSRRTRPASRGCSRATTTSTAPTRSPSATTSSTRARDVPQYGSSSLGTSRQTQHARNFLTFANSNYSILENLKSGVGEWNSVFGNMTNNLLVGYTKQDESRDADRSCSRSSSSATAAAARSRRSDPSRSRRSTCSSTTRCRCRTA